MTISLKYKIYAALTVVAVFLFAIFIGSVWSNYKTAKLEHAVEQARQTEQAAETSSREFELKAAAYEQKINYLEASLAEIEATARRQDEKLKQLANETNTARGDAGRARSVRSIESTAAELCAKLAELGHACSP